MKRKDMTDVESLQDREQKLKRKGRVFTGVIVALVLISLVLAWQSYTGRRDSWLFKEVLKVGSMQESSKEAVGVSGEGQETTK